MTYPAHILALDIRDPTFPAQCIAWTTQMRSEITETIALTRKTLANSRSLLKEADRALAGR
jgi:hypothetical protein